MFSWCRAGTDLPQSPHEGHGKVASSGCEAVASRGGQRPAHRHVRYAERPGRRAERKALPEERLCACYVDRVLPRPAEVLPFGSRAPEAREHAIAAEVA